MITENLRETKGKAIAQTNQVKRIDDYLYTVKSQSGNGDYAVTKVDDEWVCQCPDNTFRHIPCKHIHAVNFSLTLRETVKSRIIAPIENLNECIYCGSHNLMKAGKRKNKEGIIQKYLCRDCHKYFTFNIGFEKMKHNPQAITTSLQLYFSGESLRNTMKALELMGVKVSYRTILNWIRKYITLMKDYTEKMTPNVSDTWRADEIYIKFSGNMKYVFSMMDDETRFWIAQEVADSKDQHSTRALFSRASHLMGKKPETLITDGLKSYADASMEIYPSTNHIHEIMLTGKGELRHNNKMERMNGEIRDREKTMRGLKIDETAILQGYQLFHNYIRPHEALKGRTPADACGITVEGKNKWLTLIQNASKKE
jgi:transposase-like protein